MTAVSADRLQQARTVADAVLYEGYLLYPYRASSDKNRARWQFGVLGPPGAADRGLGEPDTLTMHTILTGVADGSSVDVHLRFLQLQHRQVVDPRGTEVASLRDGDRTELTWDEAVEQEVVVTADPAGDAAADTPVTVEGGEEVEPLPGGGSVLRRRWPLRAVVAVGTERHGPFTRLSVTVRNDHPDRPGTPDDATRTSLLGAHLLAVAHGCAFVSMVDPPEGAREIADRVRQDRCWPFLGGAEGDTDLLLGSPIILYDHPQVAAESAGALFDATEIDEILTLRVMTMTDEEKAAARATDPLAAQIIDRCDSMSPEAMLNLHGVLRNPHTPTEEPGLIPEVPEGVEWWDPLADNAVRPDIDAVLVNDVRVTRGSRVRLRPSRRADAQDLFFADRIARVTSVHEDVDGDQHVGVVLEDDPAADLHDWYGRYLYFAPDEVEPVQQSP